jgi:hypothetical protein
MTAAAYRDGEPVRPREVHGGNDIVGRRAARDQRGMPVVDPVPDQPGVVEAIVAGLQQRAAKCARKLLDSRVRKGWFRHG